MTLETNEANGAPQRARCGGVLLRVDGALRFLPASTVVRVAHSPRITPVPGAPPGLLGVTLHDGAIVAVLAIGSARREMVVCEHAGEFIGLLGGEVVRTGTFDASPESAGQIEYDGQRVDALDLTAIYTGIQPRIGAKSK